MPYYRWSGVDLSGTIRSGKLFARTDTDLFVRLLKNDIGLMRAKPRPVWSYKSGSQLVYTSALAHVASLLKAQVRLHQALIIVQSTITHHYAKIVWQDITQSVTEGEPLHKSMAYHPQVFDMLTQAIAHIGQETGALDVLLDKLAQHNYMLHNFKQKIMTSLTLPLATLAFFIAVVMCMLIFIVPRFELFFASFTEPLPATTQALLSVSHWVRHGNALITVISLFFIVVTIIYLLKRKTSTQHILLLKLINKISLLKLIYTNYFVSTLSMLLRGGISLPQALSLTCKSWDKSVIYQDLCAIRDQVAAGQTLGKALDASVVCNDTELKALCMIGESSGNLTMLIEQAALLYQERVYKHIDKLIKWIQPLALLILGLLIAGLIFALYIPIFTLSQIVH